MSEEHLRTRDEPKFTISPEEWTKLSKVQLWHEYGEPGLLHNIIDEYADALLALDAREDAKHRATGFSKCPFCPHPMMHHDGDGTTEHFACCNDDCDCAWEYDDDRNAVKRE